MKIPVSLRLALASGLFLVAFTLIASYIFLRWSGLAGYEDGAFAYPQRLWLWWPYLFDQADGIEWKTAAFLLVSGGIGAVPAAVFMIARFQKKYPGTWPRGFRNNFWQPRMDRREWSAARLPPAPVIGTTDNYGHAQFASDDEMAARWPLPEAAHGALVVGELYDPRTLKMPFSPRRQASWGPGGTAALLYDDGLAGSGHSVRVGGSGSGKTESLKFSLKTSWRGPAIILDPKQTLGGELHDAREAMGHDVIIIDPDHAKTSGCDVLDWLDPISPLLDARIDDVVDWVCGETPEHGGGDNSKFFTGAAKDLIRCVLSHIMVDPTCAPNLRNLRTMRWAICSSEKDFRTYLAAIKDSSPSVRARQLASLAVGEANDTLRGIHYTAHRITAWLSTQCWSDLVCGDRFKTADVTNGSTDVFIAIPFQSLVSEPAVARCLLGALFNSAFQRKLGSRNSILFALDEVAQLRQFDPLMTAWTMGREFGINLHLLYQSHGQIVKQWGTGGKSTVRNGASWISYAAIHDIDDAKELSEMIGNYPVVAVSESINSGTNGQPMGAVSRSRGNTATYSEMGRPRLRHEEIIGLREDAQLVFAGGIRPVIMGMALDYRREAALHRRP